MLINRKKVREFALEMAKHRAHKFTRVGGKFLVKCEANLRTYIRNSVHSLPSKGKTITGFLTRSQPCQSGVAGSFISPFNINDNNRKDRIHERNRNPRV